MFPIGIIEERRSVRVFTDKVVPDSVLEQILYAGICAPSPKNRQPWYYLISRRDCRRIDLITQMKIGISRAMEDTPRRLQTLQMAMETLDVMTQAPIVLFVCYRSDSQSAWDDVNWSISATDQEATELLSVGASVENILLKAQELGLAGLWCSDILYAYQNLMAFLNAEFPVVSAVCLGYPAEQPRQKPRIPFSACCKYI